MEATLSTSQLICSHCEELVHRYAARCPYCQHDLTAPLVAMAELRFAPAIDSFKDSSEQINPSVSKITPLNQDILAQSAAVKNASMAKAAAPVVPPVKSAIAAKHHSSLLPLQSVQVEQKQQQAVGITQESLIKVLVSLIALLGGSFFAFFGLILKLFSKNGRLVLEWNAETWPYYLFPALVLLVVGMAMLSTGEQETS